jgi:aerobic carbon-monoxide dehydrogenase small subunit
MKLTLKVNGVGQTLETWPMMRLLDLLREEMGLTGTKEGCGEGECGACSILMDGQLVNSCLIPAAQAEGAEIITIEGISHPVQQAFIDCGGAQCGICTPGMIVAAVSLLGKHPAPTEAEIREGLAGNLCRCTGYMRIFEAVHQAASSPHTAAPSQQAAAPSPRATAPSPHATAPPPQATTPSPHRAATMRERFSP